MVCFERKENAQLRELLEFYPVGLIIRKITLRTLCKCDAYGIKCCKAVETEVMGMVPEKYLVSNVTNLPSVL